LRGGRRLRGRRREPRRADALLLRAPRRDRSERPAGDRGSHDEHPCARVVPPRVGHRRRVSRQHRWVRDRRVSSRAGGAVVDRKLRRDRVAQRLEALDLDALLITRLPNVRYLTGYTGSNGQVVIGRDASVFLTDGRYIAQSAREVPDLERVIYANDFPGTFRASAEELGARRIGFE